MPTDLQQQKRSGKRPSFWSASDNNNGGSSSSSSEVGQPYGIDPLAVWSGEAKLVPVSVLRSIFAAVGLRASVETPLLQQAVCTRCAAALRGLADLSALQHSEVDLFVSSAKQQHLIAAGAAAAVSTPAPVATPEPPLAAAPAAAAANGDSICTEQQRLELEGCCQQTPKTAQESPTGQSQQQQTQQQQVQQPQLKPEQEELVLVSRRVLQHMLGQHAVYLSSCSAAAREGPRGGPLMTLLAAAAATQQQRGSRGGKCKSRRVCGDSAFAWAAYEDVRKEVSAHRVWPLEGEVLPAAAAGAAADAHAPADDSAGKADLGTRRRDSAGGTTQGDGGAAADGPAAAAAEDAAAAAGPALDVSVDLLCSHGNLLPLPLQHSKQKLSPRLMVSVLSLALCRQVEQLLPPV